MARTCTELLKLDFYGPRDEIEVTCHYDYDEQEGDGWNDPHRPARVRLTSVDAQGVDILPALPHGLLHKLEAQILSNEREGVYA